MCVGFEVTELFRSLHIVVVGKPVAHRYTVTPNGKTINRNGVEWTFPAGTFSEDTHIYHEVKY